jgi:citrate synthase
MAKDTLTITDNRNGKTYEVAITDGTIRSPDLKQIRISDDDFGLMGYDPGFLNTASCRSAITFIDGDKGILRYRGYPVDQLAENATWERGSPRMLKTTLLPSCASSRAACTSVGRSCHPALDVPIQTR